jgi:hypothetical protein
MKKLFFLTILVSFASFAISQVLFEFNINVISKTTDGKKVADVQITLSKGETPVKYVIINGTRLSDEILVESKFTQMTEYIFKDLPAGKYLLKIEDEQGRIAGKPFEIPN